MATTLTTKVNMNLNSVLVSDAEGLAAAQASIEQQLLISLADGVGLNQADLAFSEKAQSISAPVSKDLSGVLLDAFGATLAFVKVKALMVVAAVANTDTVIVGGVGANAFLGPFGATTEIQIIQPGGCWIVVAPNLAGYAVTAGTGDLLQFDVGAGTQVFDWHVIGTSA